MGKDAHAAPAPLRAVGCLNNSVLALSTTNAVSWKAFVEWLSMSGDTQGSKKGNTEWSSEGRGLHADGMHEENNGQ